MEESASTTRWRRNSVVGLAGVAVGVMLLTSAAWACTQRVGTLLVCRPPASSYVNGTQCGKVSGTTQTGSPSLFKAGSRISVKATNFYAKNYGVTFRSPQFPSTSCHRTATGVTVMTSATPTLAGSAAAGSTAFMGPSFQAEFITPNTGTFTGQAKVCAQDMPDVVTGQIINVTVI